MPTYEYECTRCGAITSEFKPMSAPRRQRCPSCRGKVQQLITGGLGIVFKGEGFYVNDSRAASRAKAKAGESGDKPAAADAAPAADKPAAKADAGTVRDSGKKARDGK